MCFWLTFSFLSLLLVCKLYTPEMLHAILSLSRNRGKLFANLLFSPKNNSFKIYYLNITRLQFFVFPLEGKLRNPRTGFRLQCNGKVIMLIEIIPVNTDHSNALVHSFIHSISELIFNVQHVWFGKVAFYLRQHRYKCHSLGNKSSLYLSFNEKLGDFHSRWRMLLIYIDFIAMVGEILVSHLINYACILSH